MSIKNIMDLRNRFFGDCLVSADTPGSHQIQHNSLWFPFSRVSSLAGPRALPERQLRWSIVTLLLSTLSSRAPGVASISCRRIALAKKRISCLVSHLGDPWQKGKENRLALPKLPSHRLAPLFSMKGKPQPVLRGAPAARLHSREPRIAGEHL